MRKLKLRIEPIPNFTWGISLANKLPREEWDELRQKVYRDAGYTCEICGTNNKTLHCHEVWEFDNTKAIQRLVKLECSCELCHDVHHFGRTKVTKSASYSDRCIGHWCRVNRLTRGDFAVYIAYIKELSIKRADIHYIVKVGKRVLC